MSRNHTPREGETQIGEVENYYGGVVMRRQGEGWEWSVECVVQDNWEPIPNYLAEALLRFQEELDAGKPAPPEEDKETLERFLKVMKKFEDRNASN